ncbi:hypothetical protein CLV78_102686 [Aliiruegeria haliotis]|uniref:Uncharacterized protein n=1 Tax=Aliiruegeria haliotis TaxID=1280846 RepID=A0A2T0RWE0_9RHOB|nr:hypothetical protein [Aliiruegeria haliotis]PRY25506.1 hypothetical protein CLV78_102686 [Aliiruegeria haliotis]
MLRKTLLPFALGVSLCAHTAVADEFLETLDAARVAYEDGNIQDTLEELAYAQQIVRDMKTAGFTDFLPPAPDGWTREINTDMGAAMAMFGGGVGAEATYAGNGESFNVTIMADNAMVQGFAGMLSGVGQLMGKRVRVGSEKFMNQDGELTGLVDNRILVQASGAAVEVMIPVLEQIDFEAMGGFGR